MQFETVLPRQKLYEIVADQIEQEILRHPQQVGERLPSEQELSIGFGVSRTVIREAVKVLEERKLVNVRNGEGAYIERPENDALADVLRRIILMRNIDSDNILEMRMILEPAACGLAAEKCANNPDALKKLESLYEETVKYQYDPEKRLQNDLDFHLEIARLSGNPILLCFVNAIRQMISQLMENAIETQAGNDIGVQYHQRILEVLRAGDREEAEKAMASHLRGCRKYFLQD